ncbi:MAG: Rne/Rng family ribonuclease, partial [Alphaproteobacteria bacterium]
MLIDASHPEETRVVIVSGNRLEEFDYETASKQQIKGNIYLAKVTRVEPSLQAAFVDYGGNRHGFLAFNEIHPDYYRIPVADREKLFGSDSDGDYTVEAGESPAERALADADGEAVTIEAIPDGREDGAEDDGGERVDLRDRRGDDDERNVETVGGDEDEDIDRERRRLRMLRNYRIQEVIKRRQIMLVQVTKEERGNKGAALTTYLSLAGRYCVLMPNTARGGGVSRKISNPADRKRLRAILDEFEIPDGMAVIVRTAGSERSRAEIRRDYEYLMRLWEQIRQTTLESVSPALIHEEGNLIKRSIRDLYSRDIDEVIVDGEASYRTAKDFMRMLMPSHAARVKRYKEDVVPLFQQYQVESQLDEIHSNTVRLKSGGYLVINPTEALVSIDVNSGRATRERHIEETALKTNLEAAQEVSRQLRLRDLAGLIVIDFIDMEESRNNTAVERKLKESLRGDRARIQLGRISAFGLLEMSRQRLRPSIIEASSQICPHCKGAGHIRSTESSALQALRGIEEEGLSRRSAAVQLYVPTGIALYLLNQKRGAIIASEQRYSFSVSVATDDTLIAPDFHIERLVERSAAEISQLRGADLAARAADDEQDEQVDEEDLVHEEEDVAAEPAEQDEARAAADGDDGKGRPRRRRSRRRRGRREDGTEAPAGEELQADGDYPDAGSEEPRSIAAEPAGSDEDGGESDERDSEAGADARTGEDGGPAAKSRRGRRGGRRRRRRDDGPEDSQPLATDGAAAPIDQDAQLARSSNDRDAEA